MFTPPVSSQDSFNSPSIRCEGDMYLSQESFCAEVDNNGFKENFGRGGECERPALRNVIMGRCYANAVELAKLRRIVARAKASWAYAGL